MSSSFQPPYSNAGDVRALQRQQLLGDRGALWVVPDSDDEITRHDTDGANFDTGLGRFVSRSRQL